MDGLDPRVIIIIALIMGVIYTGKVIVHKVDQGLHKAGCGIIHIVGKHCEPPPDSPDAP
jgi:hypothetical protein